MIAALGDTAKSKREPAAEPQTARSARQADPGPGLVPWPHQQAATIGISGNAPRHAAQSALAQSEAHTPAFGAASVSPCLCGTVLLSWLICRRRLHR